MRYDTAKMLGTQIHVVLEQYLAGQLNYVDTLRQLADLQVPEPQKLVEAFVNEEG